MYEEPEARRTCPECECDIYFSIQEPDYDVGLMGYGAMYNPSTSEHESTCTWADDDKKVQDMEDEVMREYPLESVDYYVD